MKSLIAIIATFPILVGADTTVFFGTNEFAFCFEDISLPLETRTAIEICLAEFISPWTNAPVEYHDEWSGTIKFNTEDSPDLGGVNIFPSALRRTATNELFSLSISKRLTDRYMESVSLLSEKEEQLTALTSFLGFLNSGSVWETSSETAMQRFHAGATIASRIPAPYTMHDYWTNEVARYQYREPTPWGFFEWPLNDNTKGTLSVEVPVNEKTFPRPDNRDSPHTSVVLSWIDGMWKFHPIPW